MNITSTTIAILYRTGGSQFDLKSYALKFYNILNHRKNRDFSQLNVFIIIKKFTKITCCVFYTNVKVNLIKFENIIVFIDENQNLKRIKYKPFGILTFRILFDYNFYI